MEITALSTPDTSGNGNLFDSITGFCDQLKSELLQEMQRGIPAM
jgi:hypothetical protein